MTTTTNKGYTLPVVGGSTGTWGGLLNTDLTTIDSNLGGTVSVNCAGSSNVTLNSTQYGNYIISLTGLLTGNISVLFGAVGGFWEVVNGTTGAFTVTVKTSAGGSTGPIVPQGSRWQVYSDGTNVWPSIVADGTQLYGIDSGTASALVVTTRVSLATLTDGIVCTVKVANANSANATLNFNGTGALPIYVGNGTTMVAIGANAMAAGQDISFRYDSSLNSGGGGWQAGTSAALTNVAFTNVANNFTQQQTITYAGEGLAIISSAAGDVAHFVSTDAGATGGPDLWLVRNSASPAASDVIGSLQLYGYNSFGVPVSYGSIVGKILDATSSSEDGQILVKAPIAGTPTTLMTLGPGAQLGAPTGGDKGVGTLNATGLYINGTAVGSGKVISVVTGTYTASADLTTVIPFDDTTPLITEGTQIISISVTTTTTTQKVRMSLNGIAGGGNSVEMTAAVFRGSTCVGVTGTTAGAGFAGTFTGPIQLDIEDAPASASTFTYTVRVGPNAGTMRMNGTASGRLYGGTAATILTATVYEP